MNLKKKVLLNRGLLHFDIGVINGELFAKNYKALASPGFLFKAIILDENGDIWGVNQVDWKTFAPPCLYIGRQYEYPITAFVLSGGSISWNRSVGPDISTQSINIYRLQGVTVIAASDLRIYYDGVDTFAHFRFGLYPESYNMDMDWAKQMLAIAKERNITMYVGEVENPVTTLLRPNSEEELLDMATKWAEDAEG